MSIILYNSKFLKLAIIVLFGSTIISCSDARDRHDKGMIQHPHSDPHGPKDSTMVQDDSTAQNHPSDQEN